MNIKAAANTIVCRVCFIDYISHAFKRSIERDKPKHWGGLMFHTLPWQRAVNRWIWCWSCREPLMCMWKPCRQVIDASSKPWFTWYVMRRESTVGHSRHPSPTATDSRTSSSASASSSPSSSCLFLHEEHMRAKENRTNNTAWWALIVTLNRFHRIIPCR